jgi:catechol 2,3-dioxygenase-like lactoylglutathione lyase family enzyme
MAIFTHICVGTNDMDQAVKFYDTVLGALGLKNMGPIGERGMGWGAEAPEFAVLLPANGEPATHANGGTIGFVAPSRAAVHAFHEAGLEAGGTCEGAPGPRTFTPTAYAAYLRDPDGNKICTYCFAAE